MKLECVSYGREWYKVSVQAHVSVARVDGRLQEYHGMCSVSIGV